MAEDHAQEDRASLEAMGIGVYRIDAEGRCTFINKAGLEMLGYAEDEVLGRNMHELIHHSYPDGSRYPQAACPIYKARGSGRPVRLSNETLWRKDGSFFTAEYSTWPMTGGASASVVTFMDSAQQGEAQRRLALQVTVSRILAGAGDLESVLPRVLAAIGGGLGWQVGLFWALNRREKLLHSEAVWMGPGVEEGEFIAQSQAMTFERGAGLPGRAWEQNELVQLPDLAAEARFPRLAAAAAAGLHVGLAFPVRSGTRTLGVIELFGRDSTQVDDDFLDTVGALGQQIGQYLRRKRAEEELRGSEELKAAILDAVLDCIITVDRDGQVVEWNPAAERTFGYAREAVVGRPLPELIVLPGRGEAGSGGAARLLASDDGPALGKRVEMEAIRADGSRFPVELAVNAIEIDGEPHYTASLRDITQRKRSEEALKRREQEFRALADNIPQLAWMADPDGAIYWYNKRWYEFTGADPEAVRGWGWRSVHHPDHLEPVAEKFGNALAAGEPWEDTFPLRGRDGEYRWFLSRAVPIRDEDGRVVRWFGTNTDVTEQRRIEEDLAAAKEAADAANLAKSQFIANMSHELRTPLSAIIGYTEMLEEEVQDLGPDGETFGEDLSKIESSARHLLSLINSVLDLSKIEAGKMEVDPEDFEVETLVREAADTVQALMAKKDNTLVLDLAPDLGSMFSDATKVRQCLFNLLSNAAKFTEGGRVTLAARRRGSSTVEFRVSDTGIGMSPEQVDKLFQRFTQADASTTRRFGGTGLGLSISKAFAEMLGGDVAVQSAEGEGTTFTLTVAADVRVPPDHATATEEDAADGDGPNQVLVIDDDPLMRDLMTRFLRREGFGVALASDGEAGLRLAGEVRPCAILLDIMMPRMDGWAVLSKLKSDPALADIPVIMVSMIQEKGLAYSLGAADYMTKPIDWTRLRSAVERYRCHAAPGSALLVEDDAATRNELHGILSGEGWTVEEASDASAALRRLDAARPDLILVNLEQPGVHGFALLKALQGKPEWRSIPVIALSEDALHPEERARMRDQVRQVIQTSEDVGDELLAELRRIAADRARRAPQAEESEKAYG